MPRLKGNTKEIIMEESLKLFAVHGFEAVSIRTIADKVGIGNSALYKHFASKQAIFDALVEELKHRYFEQCASIIEDIRGIEAVKENCLKMFEYQTQNEWIVNFRQMLLIEKFRNPKMAELYKEFFVDIPINNQIKIFEHLQEKGLMIEGDPFVFAMELYAPFYLYHFVAHDYGVLKGQYQKHVEYFFNAHFIPES
ncbi:MAG: TetR/AcrR family transcriptional regulator [bacterium]|nr:TetR/AcrR family transcriptional regulator [bacterium]